MHDHPTDEELGRFFRVETRDAWPRLHLLVHVAGCDFCRRRCRPWFELLAQPEVVELPETPLPGEEAYDRVIGRVIRRVRRRVPKIAVEQENLRRHLDASEGAPEDLAPWARVLALLDHSYELRYSDPEEMARQAFLAQVAASHLDEKVYGAALVHDLRARAAAEHANAARVLDDFEEARELFAEAERHFRKGSGDDLLRARLFDLKASLAGDERRYGEAFALLDRVCQIYEQRGERHLRGRALVSMGMFLGYQGDPERALEHCREALALLNRERDPQLMAVTQMNFLLFAAECGEYQEAAQVLFSSGLRQAFGDNPLNHARLRWVEGKVHAGLGRLAVAEHALAQVRTFFQEGEHLYNSALVGLDLAEVWLQQGRSAEVEVLAAEILQVFRRLGIGREALRAAGYLVRACDEGLLTAALLRHVGRFLTRFERDPNLLFVAPSASFF